MLVFGVRIQINKVLFHLKPVFLKFIKFLKSKIIIEMFVQLAASFRCAQIYKYEIYDFGHTLLCYFKLRCFNKPTSKAGAKHELLINEQPSEVALMHKGTEVGLLNIYVDPKVAQLKCDQNCIFNNYEICCN
jgi:hypothetical protein